MNIKTKLLKTLCLFIFVSNYNNGYTEEKIKKIGLRDFNKTFLDTCGVEDGVAVTNDNFGRLFYPLGATGNDREWLMYENSPCYDLKLMIDNKIYKNNNAYLINFPNKSSKNLIVKTCNTNNGSTYTVTRTDASQYYNRSTDNQDKSYFELYLNYPETKTNLIIPKGLTLDTKDIQLTFIGNNNADFLILGTLTNTSQAIELGAASRIFLNSDFYGNVIFFSNSKYEMIETENENVYSPISSHSDNTNFILYPGCEIKGINNKKEMIINTKYLSKKEKYF